MTNPAQAPMRRISAAGAARRAGAAHAERSGGGMTMRRSLLAFAAALLLLGACGAPGGPSPSITRLPGADHAAATDAIPLKEFVPRPQDYSQGHPDLPGLRLSHNTLMLVLTLPTTIGQANSILADLDGEIVGGIPGTAGTSRGILFLRVPSQTHGEMETLLQDLRARSAVHEAVQDGLLTGDVLPRESSDPLWIWDPNSMQSTWNHSLIRTPQLWNLNTALETSIHNGERNPTPIAVLDGGFAGSHEDLSYTNLTPQLKRSHGTHVAGIIAAKFMNGTGMEGVNPFTDLIVKGHDFGLKGADPDAFNVSFAHALVWSIHDVILSNPGIRVINISMGYGWYKDGINADADMPAQELARRHGNLFHVMHTLVPTLPVIVVSAGNDGGKNARYNSPMANAALRGITRNVIVVEGVQAVLDANGKVIGAERYPASNVNGHIAAPAAEIYSTYLPDSYCATPYCFVSGTSQAAPHVAGVIGYLYLVDPALDPPTLTSNPILDDLLLPNATPASGGASNVIDAFAAVMNIDRIRGNQQVLRMLLDIDDGTPDGNQRTDPVSGADHTANAYGGDARIDMKDFRRWRDWLLQSEVEQGLHGGNIDLDGSPGHLKKDLNLDGDVHPHTSPTAPEESMYPRGDFNGDGIISRSACATVPNVPTPATSSCPPGQVSDLDMLVTLFDDPHYSINDLDDLIDSGDLEINTKTLFERADVASVVTSLRVNGAPTVLDQRTHTRAVPRHVYTLSTTPGVYAATATARDAGGQTVATAEETFVIGLGSDAYWDPDADIVVPAANVYLLRSSVHLRATALFVGGESDTPDEYLENVTDYSGALSASATGTCGGYPGVDEVSGKVTSDVSATYALRMGDETNLLRGFGGENHHTVENFRYEVHSWERWCGIYRSGSTLMLDFEVVGGDVLMHVMNEYDADPGPSVGGGFGRVIIVNIDLKGHVVDIGPSAPASVTERHVLSPGNYRVNYAGVWTDSDRVDGYGAQSVGHRFDVSFTSNDE